MSHVLSVSMEPQYSQTTYYHTSTCMFNKMMYSLYRRNNPTSVCF